MKYLLRISFDGSKYYGWAPQKGVPTVSETIVEASMKVFGKKMGILGSGRTDRYVHALAMPVTINGDSELTAEEVMEKLNNELPEDIRVNQSEVVDRKFNVRFNSTAKKYRYLIDLEGKEDPDYYLKWTFPFDIELLREQAKKLVGTMDFASFTAKEDYQTFVRTVNSIEVSQEGHIVSIDIIGEGFMRFMVRNIVGALLSNNRGKISNEEFEDWIKEPEKGKCHYKVRGSGLYLVEVYY